MSNSVCVCVFGNICRHRRLHALESCTDWLHEVPLLALTHTRTHTLSFSLEHAQAGYINYCYSQQCIDRSSAPNSVKEGDKTLTDAWAQRTQDPPTPAGKVRVGNLCWYWMYVCRGIAVIWIPCDVCAW